MENSRWRRVLGKGGFVTGYVADAEDEADRTDSAPDEWETAWAVRTDAADLDPDAPDDDDTTTAADRRRAAVQRARADFDRDRRMTNHTKPLAATKTQPKGKPKAKPKPASVPRRDGVSSDAARRMNAHRQPLKFSK